MKIKSWRDKILNEFIPKVSRLTLVADPDNLLLEEGVLQGIKERGFELIPFEDHIAFRYVYESRFRSHWDKGEETELVVALRTQSENLDTLPYDLLQAGRRLSFSIGELFPNLSYPVVAALDRAYFAALFEAQAKYAPGPLGDNATKDFILRHIFEIAPELIKQPSDLLRVLLRRHYHGRRIPAMLDERFIQVLRRNDIFKDWPLEVIITDREAFFAFLQERWPPFLDAFAVRKGSGIKEEMMGYKFEFRGPMLLPLDHDDVKVYIDNLFLEGILHPVSHKHAETLSKTWVVCGLKISPAENRLRRIKRLFESVEKTLPTENARYEEWVYFATRWAELIALLMKADATLPEDYRKRFETLRSLIHGAFTIWIQKRYSSLIDLPPVPPVMLHHIPRFLARIVEDEQRKKIAFILLDGLSVDQWIVVREVLAERNPKLIFRESAVFAWIPTITSVCRQAAFAGKPPIYFPESINTTDKEPELWSQFWIEQGLGQQEVAYIKGIGDGELERVSELINQPKIRVVGMVVDKVDKIMHGMELGTAGMHNQLKQWTKCGFMANLIELLHNNDFMVYLTSDHGNIEAKGIGRPAEGVIAELRGERVRIYRNSNLRDQVKKRFSDSLEWPPVGLPEKYFPLIAPSRAAFVRKGESLVSHGGISVEELIVPFIHIDKRS